MPQTLKKKENKTAYTLIPNHIKWQLFDNIQPVTNLAKMELGQFYHIKVYVALVYIALNKPHTPITGLTYISNTQPQNTGLAYMR